MVIALKAQSTIAASCETIAVSIYLGVLHGKTVCGANMRCICKRNVYNFTKWAFHSFMWRARTLFFLVAIKKPQSRMGPNTIAGWLVQRSSCHQCRLVVVVPIIW